MVSLNFNAQQVKPNAALEPLPTAQYPVVITKSELKPTRNGQGKYIELEMTVQGGEFANRKVFDRLNIENANETAVSIAYATLSAICHVTGRLHIQDTSQLHGVPFIAVVKKIPRNDRPEEMTNEVGGYKDINGNDPGFGGHVAQTQAQPSWANQPQPGAQPQGSQTHGHAPAWQGNGAANSATPPNGVQGGTPANGAPTWSSGQPVTNGASPSNGAPPAWNGNNQNPAGASPPVDPAGQAAPQGAHNAAPPAAGPQGAATTSGDAPPWVRQ